MIRRLVAALLLLASLPASAAEFSPRFRFDEVRASEVPPSMRSHVSPKIEALLGECAAKPFSSGGGGAACFALAAPSLAFSPSILPALQILAAWQPRGGGGTAVDSNTPPSGSFTVNGNEIVTGTIQGGGVFLSGGAINNPAGGGVQVIIPNAQAVEILGGPADGGTAIGVKIRTSLSYANAGAKIASFQNLTTEKSYVDLNGALNWSVSGAGAATANWVGRSGNDTWMNAPTGANLFFGINNASVGLMHTTATPSTSLNGQIEGSHFAGGGGAPTSPTAGTGCGTSSAANVTGNDFIGQIGVTCGTAGTNANNFVTATFAHPYVTNPPVCVVTCANAATCAGEVLADHMNNSTTTTLAVSCAGGTCTTGTLLWNYVCGQR